MATDDSVTCSPDLVRLNALTAFNGGEYYKALRFLDDLVLKTDHVWDHRWRAFVLLRIGKYADAYKAFELVQIRNSQDWMALLVMALIKSSCPDNLVRDARVAIELARRVCDSGSGVYWSNSSVLAAALAEAGDFDNAILHIDDALQNAPEPLKSRFQVRREQYRNHIPYRLPRAGFDGIVLDGKCERCGADAFCPDGDPGTPRTVLCLECAKVEFASEISSSNT